MRFATSLAVNIARNRWLHNPTREDYRQALNEAEQECAELTAELAASQQRERELRERMGHLEVRLSDYVRMFSTHGTHYRTREEKRA